MNVVVCTYLMILPMPSRVEHEGTYLTILPMPSRVEHEGTYITILHMPSRVEHEGTYIMILHMPSRVEHDSMKRINSENNDPMLIEHIFSESISLDGISHGCDAINISRLSPGSRHAVEEVTGRGRNSWASCRDYGSSWRQAGPHYTFT